MVYKKYLNKLNAFKRIKSLRTRHLMLDKYKDYINIKLLDATIKQKGKE